MTALRPGPAPLPPEVCHHFVLSPCRRAEDAADDDDDGARGRVEVCRADEAELWTVYVMRPRGEFMVASALLDCAALADAALAGAMARYDRLGRDAAALAPVREALLEALADMRSRGDAGA